jgi:hypothetical protein
VLPTDCSVLNTSALRTVRGLLRARLLAFRAVLGLLRSRRFPPCAVSGSLRCAALHALVAPGSDCSLPDSRVSHRSRIASRSTLGLPRRARIAPCSSLPALRCPRIPPSASLSARTKHELLRARHLAFRIVLGLLRARCFPPCVARGLLRFQRLTLTAWLRRLFARPLVPAPFLEFPLRFLLFPVLGVPCFPRIAPRFTLSA